MSTSIRTTGIQQPTSASLLNTVQGLVEAVNMLQGVNAKSDRAVRLSELQNVGLLRDTGMQVAVGDRLTDLDTTLLGITGKVTAVSSALDSLTADVFNGPNGITAQAKKLTALESSVTLTGKNAAGLERTVVATAQASQELSTRVTVSEGAIDIEARRIDSLLSALSGFTAKIGDLDTELIVAASATNALGTRVTANENGVAANAFQITTLFASITDVNNTLSVQGGAINTLDTRVTATEAGLTSVSGSVVSLTSTVSTKNRTFAQPAQPSVGTQGPFAIGDMWIDTDDGNRVYIWGGTAWGDSSDTRFGARNRVFVQPTAPTGTFVINDLWIDSDDANRVYRWTGSAWQDVSDTRVAANASAVTSLNTSVTNINGTLSAQASSITTLTTTTNNNTATITSQQTSIDGLEARAFLKLDVNGKVVGYEVNNDGVTNNFNILADNFNVVSSSGVTILSAATVSDGSANVIGGRVSGVAEVAIDKFIGMSGMLTFGPSSAPNARILGTSNNFWATATFQVRNSLGTLSTFLNASTFSSNTVISALSSAGTVTRTLKLDTNGAFVDNFMLWHAGNFAPNPATGNVPTWNGSSWVAQAPAGALGFTPVQQGTGVGQTTNTVKVGWSNAGKLKLTVDVTDLGNFALESWVTTQLATKSSASTLTKVSISSTDPVLGDLIDGELRLVY